MKRIGCLGIVILALVLAVIYNQWRLEQLRGEVSALTTKMHIPNGKPGSAGKTDLVTALAETQRHTQRAKELIRKRKLDSAQAELDRALKSLKSANQVSSDIIGDAAQFLGNAREKTVAAFHKAWKDISEEARPAKK